MLHSCLTMAMVLIPLLVDDPLRAYTVQILNMDFFGLNPSFSG